MPKIRQSTTNIHYKNKAMLGRVYVPASVGPVNLVDNSSFTLTSLTGWTGDSVLRYTVSFKTAPASAYVDNPDTDANANYTKTNALQIGKAYSLSFWAGGPNAQSNVVTLYAGTAFKTATITMPSSGFTYQKIENVICTGNTTLSIQFNAPYSWTIDDVWVIQSTTAY
jgi:hypothetical protein